MRTECGFRHSPWLALAVCSSLLAGDEEDTYAWVHADTELGKGGRKAAIAFAAERKGPDVEKLRAYLTTAKPQPGERAVLNEALALSQKRKLAELCALLEPLELPKNSLLDARIWRLKAIALQITGKRAEALEALHVWNAIATRLGWLRGQHESLVREARLHRQKFRYAELAEVNGRLAVVEKQRGNALEACAALTDQAACYVEVGRLREALAVLPAAETIPDLKSWLPMRAAGHEIRATAYWQRGEFAKALYEAEWAVELWTKFKHAEGLFNSSMLLGVIQQELGEFVAAETRFNAASKLIGEGTTVKHARLKGNLGNVAWRRQRYDEALRLLGEARQEFERLSDHAEAAAACKDIGEVLIDAGRPAEAITVLEEAIQRSGSDPVAKANATAALAQALVRAGQADRALATLKSARAIEDAHWDRRTRTRLCEIEAQIFLARDKPRDAVDATRVAMDLMESTLSGLSDDQTFGARHQRGRLFEVAIESAFRTGDPATILECLERSRAAVLREAMGNRSAFGVARQPGSLADKLQRAELEVVECRVRLHHAVKGTKRDPVLKARADLAAAENALQEVSGRADRERKRIAGVLRVPPVSLGELRSTVRPGEALVVYSLHGKRADALVVTRKTASSVELGDAATIRSSCERARESYRDGDASDARLELQKSLVQPIVLDKSVRHVIVCPDGDLSHLPWPDLFGDRYASNAPSATTLALIRGTKHESSNRILAVGAADYSTSTTAPAGEITRGPRLIPLLHSRAEVTGIMRKGKGDLALLATEATEARIRAALSESKAWSTIHFACHGIVDPRFPRRSALALTQSGSDDGWLTVPEILELDVSADLVVLSACESGTGVILRGEGVVGLARAFLAAGAPRVLASLWKVNDEATKDLMLHFYTRRAAKDGPAQALRFAQAQLAKSERWSHAKYWAAWVIWGIPD